MNTTAKHIFWIMHIYATRAAEVCEYTNWSKAIATQHLREIPEKIVKAYFDEGGEALKKQHFAEMEPEIRNTILGNFDGKLRLIPIWLRPFIDPEEEVRAITLHDEEGYPPYPMSETDNDHRVGYLAYGWVFDD